MKKKIVLLIHGYFNDEEFSHCIEIEDEIFQVTKLAVKNNETTLKEKIKPAEMPGYKFVEIPDGFIRTAVRNLFFNTSKS